MRLAQSTLCRTRIIIIVRKTFKTILTYAYWNSIFLNRLLVSRLNSCFNYNRLQTRKRTTLPTAVLDNNNNNNWYPPLRILDFSEQISFDTFY